MSNNRKVICAGCQNQYPECKTERYRNKRSCGDKDCIDAIDKKVAHFNYKKQQKKIANGTYRHGVPLLIKQEIINRDNFICKLCHKICGEYKAQVHHIVPVSENGKDEHTNLILLCSSCHTTVHQNGWESYANKFNRYTANLNQ